MATIPAPRLHAASRGTGRPRRLASSTTMDAAQISPSTVNGTSRAVTRTRQHWMELVAAVALGPAIVAI